MLKLVSCEHLKSLYQTVRTYKLEIEKEHGRSGPAGKDVNHNPKVKISHNRKSCILEYRKE
jgi:hypothetical protein